MYDLDVVKLRWPMASKLLVAASHGWVNMVSAQTEGDTGYDYNDAYDDEYDDESGQMTYISEIRAVGLLSAWQRHPPQWKLRHMPNVYDAKWYSFYSSSSIAVLHLKGWRHVWPFSNCPCLPQILLHRWSAVPSSHWCLLGRPPPLLPGTQPCMMSFSKQFAFLILCP